MNELDMQRQRALQRQQSVAQQQAAQDAAREQELKVTEEQRYVAARNQNAAIARIVHVVDFLFGILELLLAARILLHMLAANPSNPFANVIYTLSEPFVALFANL
ncbi:MAG TPA: YggT family protein, partial [Aggregatilineales bacterium]|nr:YggT family protein [Aggregatilineales bacterium]